MCQKLVAMEACLKSFEETLSDNVILTITIRDKVNNKTNYANAVQAMPPPTQPHLRLADRPASARKGTNCQTPGCATRGTTVINRHSLETGKTVMTAASRSQMNSDQAPPPNMAPRDARHQHAGRSSQLQRIHSQISIKSMQSTRSSNFELPDAQMKKL